MKHCYLVLLLCFFCQNTLADEFFDGTDVLVYKVIKHGKEVRLELVKNISNREGYDNQPSFTPDSKRILYVSHDNVQQTDILEYDIARQHTKKITNTEHSEYSPFMESSGKSFTVVREGGTPYQSLHRYQYGSDTPKPAVMTQTPIGYYALAPDGGALTWARWANAIYYVTPDEKEARFIIGHAPPSKPHLIPNSSLFSLVHRQANDALWIKSFNPKDGSITPIAPAAKNNIDYAWTPSGNLISGDNTKLLMWQSDAKEWQLFADLASDDIAHISRLAVSNDFKYIAVVAKVRKP